MKIFTLLLIMIAVFVVNIVLYSTSEGYRSFLKSFKKIETVSSVTDEYIIEKDEIQASLASDLEEKVDLGISSVETKEGVLSIVKAEVIEAKELTMSEYEKEILFLFKDYNFTKLYSHSALFDLTSEFPGEYFEYYSPEVTLIMFSTKTYMQVKELLQVIGDEENFVLNEVDNFGEESFYMNVDSNFDDGSIRIVFKKEGKVFGLKISENEYNNVKNILKSL